MEVEAKFQQLLIYRVRRETLATEKLNGPLDGWLGAWGSQPKSWAWECGVLPIFPSGPFKRFAFMGEKGSLRTFLRKLCLAEAHFFWLLWADLVALAKHARMCHARYVSLERLGQGVGICMDCWYTCVFTLVTFWKLVFGRFWLGVANKQSQQFELGTSTASEEQHSFRIIHTMYIRSCELAYPHPKHVLSRWFSFFPRCDMDGYLWRVYGI